MARTEYVKANRITQELKVESEDRWRAAVWIGIPVAALATLLKPDLYALWIGLLIFLLVGAKWYVDPIRATGAAGEEYLLRYLLRLPDSYTIFNQVEVPDSKSRTGTREIDFVVCGPTGLFAIEVKNWNGEIEGGENDSNWIQHKVGRGGTPYSDSKRNPVRQVKQQVRALELYLYRKGVTDPVTGIIVMAGGNDLSGLSVSTPVMHMDKVASFISNHEPKFRLVDFEDAVTALAGINEKHYLPEIA